MTEPWRRDWKRLGLRLGFKTGEASKRAIGWTLLNMQPDPPLASGTTATDGDPVAAAVTRFEAARAEHGVSEVVLYRYTERTFSGSRPEAEGMTLSAHAELVERVADALRERGAKVTVQWA